MMVSKLFPLHDFLRSVRDAINIQDEVFMVNKVCMFIMNNSNFTYILAVGWDRELSHPFSNYES
jgi:hypothetical protein